MGLVGTLAVGAVALVSGAVGLYFAVGSVREAVEAVRVVTGPETPPDAEGATYLAVEVADDPDLRGVALGQVRDTFGYWVARYWATGARTNAFTLLGGLVLKAGWGPDDYRDGNSRLRGWAVLPGTVPVRVDGRRVQLTVGEDARPLQRLEADGGTVPFLAGTGVTALALLTFASPVLGLLVLVVPGLGVAAVAFVVLVVVGLVGGKLYHDTGTVGRWAHVTDLDDDVVPGPLAEAGATPDPASTARVDLATAEPGDRLGVVGTVESTADGLRVVDGVVSTRGRWFLAAAATLDAVRTAVFALVALLVAAGAGGLLYLSLAAGSA